MKIKYLIRKQIIGLLVKGIIFLFFLFKSPVQAQQYINGNLSTGSISSKNVAASDIFIWSEIQPENTGAGFGATISGNLTLADNFKVSGFPWIIKKFTFLKFSNGFAGASSSFNEVRFRIFNADPLVGNSVPVFGDLATNNLSASTSANMYRIFNIPPDTTRQIWKLETNVNITLNPVTYWIKLQIGVVTPTTSNFIPPSKIVGIVIEPSNNTKHRYLTANTVIINRGIVNGTIDDSRVRCLPNLQTDILLNNLYNYFA